MTPLPQVWLSSLFLFWNCVHALIPCHASADGDDAKAAEMVRRAMLEANLSVKVIEAFKQSDLLELHNVGGYTSALFIQNAQRAGLDKCRLKPALVDLLVADLDRLRGEWDSCSDWKPLKIAVGTNVPHGLAMLCLLL